MPLNEGEEFLQISRETGENANEFHFLFKTNDVNIQSKGVWG